jgi:hypothetical protein
MIQGKRALSETAVLNDIRGTFKSEIGDWSLLKPFRQPGVAAAERNKDAAGAGCLTGVRSSNLCHDSRAIENLLQACQISSSIRIRDVGETGL